MKRRRCGTLETTQSPPPPTLRHTRSASSRSCIDLFLSGVRARCRRRARGHVREAGAFCRVRVVLFALRFRNVLNASESLFASRNPTRDHTRVKTSTFVYGKNHATSFKRIEMRRSQHDSCAYYALQDVEDLVAQTRSAFELVRKTKASRAPLFSREICGKRQRLNWRQSGVETGLKGVHKAIERARMRKRTKG